MSVSAHLEVFPNANALLQCGWLFRFQSNMEQEFSAEEVRGPLPAATVKDSKKQRKDRTASVEKPNAKTKGNLGKAEKDEEKKKRQRSEGREDQTTEGKKRRVLRRGLRLTACMTHLFSVRALPVYAKRNTISCNTCQESPWPKDANNGSPSTVPTLPP